MTGNGNVNENGKATALQMYGIKPETDGATAGEVKIAGNGAFFGAVYAPDHAISFRGGGNSDIDVIGSFTGKTIFMNGHTSVHYDQALSRIGLVNDYQIISWFEDVR